MKTLAGMGLILLGVIAIIWIAKMPTKSSPSQDLKLYVGGAGFIAVGIMLLFEN